MFFLPIKWTVNINFIFIEPHINYCGYEVVSRSDVPHHLRIKRAGYELVSRTVYSVNTNKTRATKLHTDARKNVVITNSVQRGHMKYGNTHRTVHLHNRVDTQSGTVLSTGR